MKHATPEVDIRQLSSSDADLERFAATFAAADNPKELPHLDWQYRQNLCPQTLIDVAESSIPGGLAAVYAFFGSPGLINNAIRPVAQCIDSLTDEAYRGRGLYTRLAGNLNARTADSGYAFVYGFPGGLAVHGCFSTLKWQSLDPLPMLIRPFRTRYFASRVSSLLTAIPNHVVRPRRPKLTVGEEFTQIESFGPEHEALWREMSGSVGVAVDRSARYLNWRLIDRPNSRYKIWSLDRNGRTQGFVAYTVEAKHGGRIGYIMELISAEPGGRAERQLLRKALDDLCTAGADATLAWNMKHSPNASTFRREFFIPMPERIRPIDIHFGVLPLDESIRNLVSTRSEWYLSYLDSDTV